MHCLTSSRRIVLGLVVGTALAPHTLACAARTVPRSEATLAEMSDRVDVRIAMDSSARVSVVTLDGLWAAPSKQAPSGDDVPPLDDCPSLPADTRVTVDGLPVAVTRGGWQEMTSGGCDRDASVTTYTCAPPSMKIAWESGSTIVFEQGNRTWTIELGAVPHTTRATFARVPVPDEGVADLTFTPRVPAGTDVVGRVSLSDCRGLVWSVDSNFLPTALGVTAVIPRTLAPPRACPTAAADGGAPRDAGADADGSPEAGPSSDSLDAGHADVTVDDVSGMTIAASLQLSFPTRVARCDGPRGCRLSGRAEVDVYATAPFVVGRAGAGSPWAAQP